MKKVLEKLKVDKKFKNQVIGSGSVILAVVLFMSCITAWQIKGETSMKANGGKDAVSESQIFNVVSENTTATTAENESSKADVSETAPSSSAKDGNAQTPTVPTTNKGNGKKEQPTKAPTPTYPVEPPDYVPAPPTSESIKYATKADEKAVADRVIYYINKYRKEEGKKAAVILTGKNLTAAQMRSKQLVTNFAHDSKDMQSVANALKYGHVTPNNYEYNYETQEHTFDGTFSYIYGGHEAIVMGSMNAPETVDGMAKRLAKALHDSQNHWCYVGTEEYISVGVTYANSIWYVSVNMLSESSRKYDTITENGNELYAYLKVR